MKTFQSILSEESEGYQKTLSRLVSGYNCISDVEDAFEENKTAKKYLESAVEEALLSGNYGLSSMYVIAIQKMANDLEKLNEEVNNAEYEKLYSMCRKLEKENMKLKSQLSTIIKVISEDY